MTQYLERIETLARVSLFGAWKPLSKGPLDSSQPAKRFCFITILVIYYVDQGQATQIEHASAFVVRTAQRRCVSLGIGFWETGRDEGVLRRVFGYQKGGLVSVVR